MFGLRQVLLVSIVRPFADHNIRSVTKTDAECSFHRADDKSFHLTASDFA